MAHVTAEELSLWQQAVGRELAEEAVLAPSALRRFAQAVGLSGEQNDTPLPHWAFFLPSPLDAEIGADGHPKRGGFLPDITLPRRMFAGARIEFHGALEIGAMARQTSRVAELSHKSGRSGDLVFARVEKTLEQDNVLKVREVQTYVYRGEGGPVGMPIPLNDAGGGAGEVWQPNAVNLFRFSAATANGHRIHYDHPYATGVEGYPALVVHGPFTAAKLAGLAMRDGQLATFSFRAQAPLFLGQPILLRRSTDGQFEAIRCDGVSGMIAEATYS